MIYRVIGVISDNSQQGVEISFVEFLEQGGKWSFEVVNSEIYSFSEDWIAKLNEIEKLTSIDYLQLHSDFGHFIGQLINTFIEQHQLHYKIAVIGSLGYLVTDIQSRKMIMQIGNGAVIAALTRLPVVSDFYSLDVALGGSERNGHLLENKLNSDTVSKSVRCAFMGVLRWREEFNVFAAETGASRNSIGGALWLGQDA